MKSSDWNGYPKRVKAKCMDLKHGLGVEFRLKAHSEEEARTLVAQTLSTHHGPFIRKSDGDYRVVFERL